ncbi:MAG: hypothetical protein AAF726_21900 [Planctomycetota bacterium]
MHTNTTRLAVTALALGAVAPLSASSPSAVQEHELRRRQPLEVREDRVTSSPLARGILPADTSFVVHVDLQGLMRSVWWKSVEEATGIMDEIADDDDFAEMSREFGVDPFKDFLGVTVIGHDEDGDDAVVVIHATDRIDAALDRVRAMDEYRLVAHDGLELECFMEGDDEAVFGAVLGERESTDVRVVVGQNRDRVSKVIRTMLGDANSVADIDGAAVQAQPRKGSYVFVEVGLPFAELLEDTPASRVASKARRFTLDMGQRKDSVFIDAVVESGSDRDARDIADVVNGVRSMVTLSGVLEQIPVGLSEAFEDARAEIDGRSVRMGLSIPIEDLRESLIELQEQYR